MKPIQTFETEYALQDALGNIRKSGLKIGFVPTMGALHKGHLSLIEYAQSLCDHVVVSIFVNPTQFNNPSDLAHYPRTEQEDLALLSSIGVEFVFLPNPEEVYPLNYSRSPIDLGILESVMEGAFRPGHFQGVVEVVKRLFEMVKPDLACFGEKDFQQVAVIRYMTQYFNLPVRIETFPTHRNAQGLALSSRNMRLSNLELDEATIIYKALDTARILKASATPKSIKALVHSIFELSTMRLEYFEIVDGSTLQSLEESWADYSVACIAVYCGEVRLIDNMRLS